MHLNDINDDLGTAKKPFTVVACIPVLGRGPLLKHTIERLYKKNGVLKVITVGHENEDRKICEAAGAEWIQYRNKPLGAKWNEAFKEAKKYHPDACLYVGSSDWLSDNWLHIMQPYLNKYDFVGTPGCYFLDISATYRLCKWKGYVGQREDETIGIGRLLSANLLDKLHWRPFGDLMDRSLDRSMKDLASKHRFLDFKVKDDSLIALSISTNRWVNKHHFNHHYNNILPSEKIRDVKGFIDLNFPEAWNIFPQPSNHNENENIYTNLHA